MAFPSPGSPPGEIVRAVSSGRALSLCVLSGPVPSGEPRREQVILALENSRTPSFSSKSHTSTKVAYDYAFFVSFWKKHQFFVLLVS